MDGVRLAGAFVILLVATPATAQPAVPVIEIFGGYSLLPANGDDFPRVTSHGVQTSLTANLNRWFGVVFDAGVQWSTATDLGPNFPGLTADTRVTEVLAGPRVAVIRSDRTTLFVNGLFGVASGDAGKDFSGFSDSAAAFGGGGGVDVYVTERLAWRAQFDLLGSFADIVEGNTRFATGVVLKLGER